ncbi:uncharacterized protein DUF2017 [Leucobacter luti]|uniref:DUF2017 family protein n=1 Tax=Leucobacter luti TaxID=340320 RepID=UPI00104B9E2B|nr:DUF2017 family protein [Leucobacter luti]MCW2288097.1 hypothetical protein [Leucobacter luti]TCK45741.1 uncharacterized protein DUF2017 [Leucobacter luti]
MKLLPRPGGLRILFEYDEAAMLDQLITQLTQLLQSHSGTALDPDPLFASLEVGGSEELPEDPALARLFPDAYDADEASSSFRRVTEQGLLNRKLQDAIHVTSLLGLGDAHPTTSDPVTVDISAATLPAWVRTITALRLAIAARIGLDTSEDRERLLEQDDTRGTVLVFDWLAAILESVLTIMSSPDEPVSEEDSPTNGAV